MNRRRALRSLFCVSFGGAAALILASCEVVTAPDTETTDEVAELPLAEILQRTKALSESIASKVRECNSAGSLTLTVSMVESAALCEFALTRIRRSRSSSPAFWQSCADSATRSAAFVTMSCETLDSPLAKTAAAMQFSQLADRLNCEAMQRAFAGGT